MTAPRMVPHSVAKPLGRRCTRWLRDFGCDMPAQWHVIWDKETLQNGFVCEDHLVEVGSVFSFYVVHPVGPYCGMPGGRFFDDGNVCRSDEQEGT